MTTYRIASTAMIYTPGVLNWIVEAVTPFDRPRAIDLLEALGLPLNAAEAVADGNAKISTEDEMAVVEVCG
jgi:hypothetical protein